MRTEKNKTHIKYVNTSDSHVALATRSAKCEVLWSPCDVTRKVSDCFPTIFRTLTFLGNEAFRLKYPGKRKT